MSTHKLNPKGKVYLIGAGPGDEGLLTLKGAEYLSRADVVIYDFLSNEALLSMAPAESEKIYVGKKASSHTRSQKEINSLLVGKAMEGKIVVRLKGGDPYVFGRGGEEALALYESGLYFEVVPGITAGIAAAAYAGIPFTHRGIASTAGFITGHEMEGKNESGIDWKSISGLGTLVFYMGVKNLPVIVTKLREAGRPGDTPTAIIQWGTMTSQRSAEGTLDSIVEIVEKEEISTPALIVIGDVVRLRSKLNWFEKKTLFGKKIIVTRSTHQASRLKAELVELGAEVVEFPTIVIKPIVPNPDLDGAIKTLSDYSWIIFTSVNSADIFLKKIMSVKDARILAGVNIAAIGSETSRKLAEYGLRADLVPEKFTSEGIVEILKKTNVKIKSAGFLIPGSSITGELLSKSICAMGGLVKLINIYETVIPEYTPEYIDSIFKKKPDFCTFTSPSTVNNLIEILNKNNRSQYIDELSGASIGPATSEAVKEAGIKLSIEAGTHTIQDLVMGIVNKSKNKGKQ